MIQLTPIESRVLGVLIEKSTTTPEQYPLSLNAVTSGANQKNNRDPVLALGDEEIFDALETLRGKALVVRVDIPGNRVNKYRHTAADTLHARPAELAIIAELLLRGPQTLGELRGRASRMAPFESLDAVKGMLAALMTREEPMVKELPPSPGSRAERYAQLLCPDSHPVSPLSAPVSAPASPEKQAGGAGLSDRVSSLESRLQSLEAAVRRLAAALGEPAIVEDASPERGQPGQ